MVEAPHPTGSKAAGNAPRSDASTLHVDFEKVTDTLVMARNAGVFLDPWTRDSRSRIRILDSFGFQGRRCAHIAASGATAGPPCSCCAPTMPRGPALMRFWSLSTAPSWKTRSI